jgi:hypothetical protein
MLAGLSSHLSQGLTSLVKRAHLYRRWLVPPLLLHRLSCVLFRMPVRFSLRFLLLLMLLRCYILLFLWAYDLRHSKVRIL